MDNLVDKWIMMKEIRIANSLSSSVDFLVHEGKEGRGKEGRVMRGEGKWEGEREGGKKGRGKEGKRGE